MVEKTKIVMINGREYQIGRLSPVEGSFILNRLIGAGLSSIRKMSEGSSPEAPSDKAAKATGEEAVRALASAALLGSAGFDLETFRIVQKVTISACSRLEGDATSKLPMPIMNSAGNWAIADVRDDVGLVSRLMTEAMVFNFASFFDQGGMTSMMGV